MQSIHPQLDRAATCGIHNAIRNIFVIVLFWVATSCIPKAEWDEVAITLIIALGLPVLIFLGSARHIRSGKSAAVTISIVNCSINLLIYIAVLVTGVLMVYVLSIDRRSHWDFVAPSCALAIAAMLTFTLFRNINQLARCYAIIRNLSLGGQRGFEPIMNRANPLDRSQADAKSDTQVPPS